MDNKTTPPICKLAGWIQIVALVPATLQMTVSFRAEVLE